MKEYSKQLEELIDKHGLRSITEELAMICYEKAQHIRENWQDDKLAKTWDKDAKTVINATARIIN